MMRALSAIRSELLSGLALVSCSLAALGSTPASAQTSSGAIVPYYGTISPFYGNISSFYGSISPFYGNISPFYGNISPFYGNISAFWTNDDPFMPATNTSVGAFYGSANDPFWGSGSANPYTNNPSKYVNYSQIAGFWGTESSSWMTVFNDWSAAKTSNDYVNLANLLQNTIINPANSFWAQAVTHGSSKTVGGIADSLLTNAGVSFDNGVVIDPTSLADVSQTNQAMFFLDFYDSLMSYSGTGHVDWWMGTANWSPALAKIATSDALPTPLTIGMLDFTATNNTKNPEGSVLEYGSNEFSNGHGAAVEGLIAGSMDGTGIMGVMPSGSAKVVVYDPYDSTDTTNWTDIGTGYATLVAAKISLTSGFVPGATVVNASLGVPGWTFDPGWNSVFTSNLTLSLGGAHNTILVVAAGNTGTTQTTNVPWNFANNPTLLIVGSVGVNGTISNFSNLPGTACLTNTSGPANACTESLASRYIVAPGELILISDNAGNISRQTGTSLAAPLVTGAIGLLEARWPWLASDPTDTANIILESATKLGTNPGDDPVYGAGELNIQASQSPLNWKNLQYYPVTNGLPSLFPVSATTVINTIQTGSQSSWNASHLYFTALENIGSTHRDFQIPLSSNLVGQTVSTQAGFALFQSYLNASIKSWIAAGAHLEDDDVLTSGMAGFLQSSTSAGKAFGMDVRVQITPAETPVGYLAGSSPYNTRMAFIGNDSTLQIGFGDGASALDSQEGFGQRADYNIAFGGANPFLGLASGGEFIGYRSALSDSVDLNVGMTGRRDTRNPTFFGVDGSVGGALTYGARAEYAGLDVAADDGFIFHSSLTELHEDSGLLGTQSIDTNDLSGGSNTTALSVGLDYALPEKMTFTATGTIGRTTTGSAQALRIAPSGLLSSSEEIALSKSDLFTDEDRFRISISKSLQVDSGAIEYWTYGVVDRQTGKLGVINETIDPSTSRTPVSAEILYGRLLWDNSTDVSLIAQAEMNGIDATTEKPFDFVLGAKLSHDF